MDEALYQQYLVTNQNITAGKNPHKRGAARRKEYLNACEYVSVSNTPPGEFLGEIAVRHHAPVVGRTREVTRANLELLERVVAQAAGVLDWVRPAGGMTVWLRLVSREDAHRFCEEALEYGLQLAPGDCWGFSDHSRIGFGIGPEWYSRAMERFFGLFHTRSRCRAVAISWTGVLASCLRRRLIVR